MRNDDRAFSLAALWILLAILLCFCLVVWQRNAGVTAQTSVSPEARVLLPSTGTPAPTLEPAATSVPTETPTVTPTATSTATALPLTTEELRALIRARIRALILAAAATPTPEPNVIVLPLVQNQRVEPAPTPGVPAPSFPVADGVPRTARVPILMYHYISVPPADADIYRRDLSVTPERFAHHLDRLQAEGYTTISLYDLHRHLLMGTPLPAKPVILTFDDGYRDNYENAFPLLRARGMTATFFVVTDFVDEQRPEYLTWEMVREMYAAGMSIESHGRNHASLRGQDDDYLVWQALGSLETIEYELGVRPRFVSYPAGAYDDNTVRIFQSAHYWAGVTTEQGTIHRSGDLFQLPRVRVRGTTDAEELIRLMEVDW